MGRIEWQGKILEQRSKNRKNYSQGPKSSPQQWQTYVRLFSNHLTGKKAPVILILGSTPELRDLALSYSDSKVIVADINPDMVIRMANLMKYKNNPREHFLHTDWINLGLSKKSIDYMVGDAALPNLKPDQIEIFFRQANNLIKPDGYLLLREGGRKPALVKTPEEIIQQSRQQKWHWFDLHFYLYLNSAGYWYNHKTHQSSMSQLYQWIKKAHQQGILNDQEFANLWPWKGNLVHTWLLYDDYKNLFNKYFTLENINQPNDLHYQKFLHFFAGKPKK